MISSLIFSNKGNFCVDSEYLRNELHDKELVGKLEQTSSPIIEGEITIGYSISSDLKDIKLVQRVIENLTKEIQKEKENPSPTEHKISGIAAIVEAVAIAIIITAAAFAFFSLVLGMHPFAACLCAALFFGIAILPGIPLCTLAIHRLAKASGYISLENRRIAVGNSLEKIEEEYTKHIQAIGSSEKIKIKLIKLNDEYLKSKTDLFHSKIEKNKQQIEILDKLIEHKNEWKKYYEKYRTQFQKFYSKISKNLFGERISIE